MGNFEHALVFYHRGHKIRPELHEFTLGIQKAQEAINNSIGSKHCFGRFCVLYLNPTHIICAFSSSSMYTGEDWRFNILSATRHNRERYCS